MDKKQRPASLKGTTTRVPTGCGNMYVTVNKDNGSPMEVFIVLGKCGGCSMCTNEALGRLISLALKYNIPADEITLELDGLQCPSPVWDNGDLVKSCVDGVAKVMKEVSGAIVGEN